MNVSAVETKTILVFPAGMPASIAFAHGARREGFRVVGASSLAHDPERGHYTEWAKLPWVLDQGFEDALAELISIYDVDEIYTPHPVVWDRLAVLMPSLPRKILLHQQDWDRDLAGYARQFQMADQFCGGIWQTPLASANIAGLIRLFELTPGQCSHTKLEAMIALFRDLPAGDIVEIGSLFGRTALAFAFLARHFQTGKVLCVDPWSSTDFEQGTKEVDQHARALPMDEIFRAFTANLAPWFGTVNYIRKPSLAAAADYASGIPVVTKEFGSSHFTHKISILHLDGNHAYAFIRDDLRVWGRYAQAGGWIIFDDYLWPFGDGPRRVADDFCSSHRDAWSTAFEVGGALFVRLNK
jgi:hypothetical protein